jgi:uncharacterized repeat protein (TIGR03803 family)
MTRFSAARKAGIVFALCAASATASFAQTFTNLADFDKTNGAEPYGSLVQGHDGAFYGTTSVGGANGEGTVFKITPRGILSTLYSFCAQANCTDGANPYSGLALATDGNFYGTTGSGGIEYYGTIFKITPEGKLTTLHSFTDGTDGAQPIAGLVQATDGNFYGTTYKGGDWGFGTVFKITPSGTLTMLHSFCAQLGCPDGSDSNGLVEATDGNLYGTTRGGGISDGGTVFKITLQGKLTTLHSFSVSQGNPEGALIQATDGNLYGTTTGASEFNVYGTVFKITPEGILTLLYLFKGDGGGAFPAAGLIQGTDGNLYGTTYQESGDVGYGTVFDITPSGTLTELHTFLGADGAYPESALLQATNGTFYGTTVGGGGATECGHKSLGCGTVYSLDMGLGPFVAFVRAGGKVGETGPILGQGFTGTTSVSINGIPASFTVVSDTFIEATVPQGATTGYVTVVTPSSTLTSNVPFRVIPQP